MAQALNKKSNYTQVNEISIQSFRAIEAGAVFPLGPNITLIAGQNGTSKSTLLGMIAQPLGFPEKPKADSKYTTAYHGIDLLTIRTLTGDRFKANYSDVFRTSTQYDKPRSHQYTLFLNGEAINPDSRIAEEGLSVRSEGREDQLTNKLRFVTTSSSRRRGEGNFPHPVIFLGLDRLRPLAKCEKVTISKHSFNSEDLQYWIHEYKKILNYLPQENIRPERIDTGKAKGNYQSLRADNHDSESASAGQDNVGQILTAVMSFRQLKRELADRYRGGLLLIDEVDATLHPTSQELLFDFLISASKELGIQIVATTHSLTLLQYADKQSARKTAQLVYLQKRAGKVRIVADIDFEFIEKDIANIRRDKTTSSSIKTTVLFEDNIACTFFKAITGRLFSSYISTHTTAKNNRATSLSNGVLSTIAKRKIPEFQKIIFVLDPDSQQFVTSSSKNLLALPGNGALESMMYYFLSSLSDDDQCWDNILKCSQQECFTGHNNLVQGKNDISKYKAWFKKCTDKGFFSRGNQALYKLWMEQNLDDCGKFALDFLSALKATKNSQILTGSDEVKKNIDKKYKL